MKWFLQGPPPRWVASESCQVMRVHPVWTILQPLSCRAYITVMTAWWSFVGFANKYINTSTVSFTLTPYRFPWLVDCYFSVQRTVASIWSVLCFSDFGVWSSCSALANVSKVSRSLWSNSGIKSRRTVCNVSWLWNPTHQLLSLLLWLTFYVYSLYWSYTLWSCAGWKRRVIECQCWCDCALPGLYILHNSRCLALRLISTKTCLLACDQSSAQHVQLLHKIMGKCRTGGSGLMMQRFKFSKRINVSWMLVYFRPERPFICWKFT